LDAHVAARHGQAPIEPGQQPTRFPTRIAAGAGALIGAAGAGLAVLAGMGAVGVTALGVVGAAGAGAVGTTVYLVRNRGPPSAPGLPTSVPAGLAARGWTDRVLIGTPLLIIPVAQRPALIALVGAGLIGLPLILGGVPGADLVTLGATVVAGFRLLGGVLRALVARLPTAESGAAGRVGRAVQPDAPRGLLGVLTTASPVLGTALWLAVTGDTLVTPLLAVAGGLAAAWSIVAMHGMGSHEARGSP